VKGKKKHAPIITYRAFEPIDIGICECRAEAVIWGSKTDILIIVWGIYEEYNDVLVLTQCAKQSNRCLDWIEQNKEYIQNVILDSRMSWMEYGFAMAEKDLLDRLDLKKIQMEMDIREETEEAGMSACMDMELKPFFFHEHCHCIKVAMQAQEDGTYEADLMEDIPQFLSEIRDALKEEDMEACEWAKNHRLFYAFDEEGNMLAVVRQQFCMTIDGKLISEMDEDDKKREGLSDFKLDRNAIYFVNAEYGARWGTPLPSGFITKELICKNGVFTIISSSGHKAVSGTFFGMQEALTMIEMLYCTRGVTEEEIDKCFYEFLGEIY